MANHNQYKKISTTPQANTIPYANEDGFITAWLDNDPLITSLKQQNEFIGSIATAPEPDRQSILTQFVVDTTGRQPRNGDEVAIEDVGELWEYNGTEWVFFTTTTLADASTTNKGLMQVGSGLLVTSGLVSVDDTRLTMARAKVTNTSTTPSLALQENTDYMFSNALTSLTLGAIPDSQYFISLNFTTGSTFIFSAPNLTDWYFVDNPPTFLPNKKYEIIIVNGKAHIYYVGQRIYPINKIVVTNPQISPVGTNATWTISNTLATKELFIRVYETATGDTVDVNSNTTISNITVTFYAESVVSAGTYTAVILG